MCVVHATCHTLFWLTTCPPSTTYCTGVGGSVTTQLLQHGAHVVVGGTNHENFVQARQRWERLFPGNYYTTDRVSFATLDRERVESVVPVLLGQERNKQSEQQQQPQFDLVVHTAGPFQGKVSTPNGILQACLEVGIPYIDVCDDYSTATAARQKHAQHAVERGVPCILSTGCWPGVSSLMAAQTVAATLRARPDWKPSDLRVDFSFFTAGSGGAGVTLLVATFLILAEPALQIVHGQRRAVPPLREFVTTHFGARVGPRAVAPLNLLETASVHDVLGVGSVHSRFGTAPAVWNVLLGLMALLPSTLLANEPVMRNLSVFSLPIVRAVDAIAGATNAMRCDVTGPTQQNDSNNNNNNTNNNDNWKVTTIYAHDNLEPCVGECVTAFACAVLTPGVVAPGLWFPEQAVKAGPDAAAVLALASIGAHTTDVETTTKSMSDVPTWLTREHIWGKAHD